MPQTKLGLYALFLEGVAWSGILLGGGDDRTLLLYLFAHAGASAVLALLAISLLPARLTRPRLPAFLLLAGFGYAVPVLGFLGLLVAIIILRHLPDSAPEERFRALALPALDPHQRIGTGFRQVGMRSFLKNQKSPVDTRIRALIALQNVSGKIASPLLRDVLADPSEDIRLLAYGMLDNKEKAINKAIHVHRTRLTEADSDAVRSDALRHLSGLYWELVYQDLAQGALRTHALEQSLDYTEQMLALDASDAAMHLRQGHLFQLLGKPEPARLAYLQALQLGLPKTRIVPYLAELAYDLHDYVAVQQYMEDLAAWESLPRLRPVIDYWRGARA